MKISLILLLACASLQAGCANYSDSNGYYRHLRRYEGYDCTPYGDTFGYTVGIGHHLTPTEPFRIYSDEEVLELFQRDLDRALKTCRIGIRDFDSLNPKVREVCVGIEWTVGSRGFMKFKKFRQAISARDYKTAAAELKNSKWYGQVSRRRADDYVKILLTCPDL